MQPSLEESVYAEQKGYMTLVAPHSAIIPKVCKKWEYQLHCDSCVSGGGRKWEGKAAITTGAEAQRDQEERGIPRSFLS